MRHETEAGMIFEQAESKNASSTCRDVHRNQFLLAPTFAHSRQAEQQHTHNVVIRNSTYNEQHVHACMRRAGLPEHSADFCIICSFACGIMCLFSLQCIQCLMKASRILQDVMLLLTEHRTWIHAYLACPIIALFVSFAASFAASIVELFASFAASFAERYGVSGKKFYGGKML